jgi:hypothetical protein
MTAAARSLYGLVVLVVLFGVFGRQTGSRRADRNRGLPESLLQLRRETRRTEELNAAIDLYHRSLPVRRHVAEAVAAGHLGLLDGARTLRDLTPMAPDVFREAVARAERGDSEGERFCRHAIRFVASTLEEQPERASRVVARLEAELQAHLARHGTVVLPEGGASAADTAGTPPPQPQSAPGQAAKAPPWWGGRFLVLRVRLPR